MAAEINNIPYKIYLSEDEMPKAWYNVRADMKVKPAPLLNPYYNHTSVGGAFEFKVKDNFSFGVGVNYEYNPWNKRMDPQFLFYPAFKGKNIRIGIN